MSGVVDDNVDSIACWWLNLGNLVSCDLDRESNELLSDWSVFTIVGIFNGETEFGVFICSFGTDNFEVKIDLRTGVKTNFSLWSVIIGLSTEIVDLLFRVIDLSTWVIVLLTLSIENTGFSIGIVEL